MSAAATIRGFAARGSAPRLDPGADRSRSPFLVSGALLTLAIVSGLLVGGAQSWAVLHLPDSLVPLDNTAAPWFIVAFAVAVTARLVGGSMTLSVVCLLATVMSFYVVEDVRGFGVSTHQVLQWSACSIVVGPFLGLAAGAYRHAGRWPAAIGAGLLGGLLAGEAVWDLTGLSVSNPAGYGYAQLALGVALTVTLTVRRSRHSAPPTIAAMLGAALATEAVVGLATWAAFKIGS